MWRARDDQKPRNREDSFLSSIASSLETCSVKLNHVMWAVAPAFHYFWSFHLFVFQLHTFILCSFFLLVKYILVFIFSNFFSMFALCCYPSLSIRMLIPANNRSCAAFPNAALWHFLLQPSHYEWRMPQALMEWMCCAFQSFPAEILKLLCCRCAGSTVLPMLTNNNFLLLCIFLSACLCCLRL